jgi:dipeptidyl-peptidase-3
LAAFLQNCGNYKSFGDTKFIPELPKERFWRFITLSKAYTQEDGVTRARIDELWNLTNLELYEFAPPYYLIEMPSKGGSSSYYSSNVTQEEA